MTNEHWLPIPGYEGFYEASNCGRVRSLTRVVPRRFADGQVVMGRFNGRVLASQIGQHGYHMVAVCRGGRRTMTVVHRLVLEAFVGPCPDGMECCHRDGVRTNNHVSNLYWGTRVENSSDSVRHGTAHWTTRTECPNGHLYDKINTAGRRGARGPGTVRKCRICYDAAQRRYQARKAAS